MSVLGFFDVVILVIAAPIMILIGVPAAGYGIGAAAWIVLRAVGVVMERVLAGVEPTRAIGIRLGYMLGRLFTLALAVIIARNADGRNAGIACLAVIVFAFTVSLATSALTRPRSR